MKRIALLILMVGLCLCTVSAQSKTKSVNEKKYTMLCLGDSYTIGESVAESERFPMQAAALLAKDGIHFSEPQIIAKTGWTTDELIHAMQEAKVSGTFDYVTLLIGVNNQYRGYDTAVYRREFTELLHTAIHYAAGNRQRVYVLSIPDWGVTPFGAADGKGRTPTQIGHELDAYNAINKEVAAQEQVHYIDITPISRRATTDGALIANDNLHPSGKMYAQWAKLLAAAIAQGIKK
jgi:lysophospholipase L1-like esterase